MKIGDAVSTADGDGTIVDQDSGVTFSRWGVKHHVYPANRVVGMYRDDVLFYMRNEVFPVTSSDPQKS